MSEEKQELGLNDLGEISGGYIYHNKKDKEHNEKPYEIIGKDGSIIERFATWQEARNYAYENNISSNWISSEDVEKLKKGEKLTLPKLKPIIPHLYPENPYIDLMKKIESYQKNKKG